MSSNQAGSIVTSSDLWQAQQEWEDEEIVYMSGYPDDNPKTAYGEAKPKMSDTPTVGIREMGKVFTGGAEKRLAFGNA